MGEVEIEGRRELAHIANTGRLEKLLIEGKISYLLPINRKLRYKLFAIEDRGNMVVVDSFIGEKLLEEKWRKEENFPYMGRVMSWKKAPKFNGVQIDYLVDGENGVFLVEQKSSTLLEGDTAFFPDAPTKRGLLQLSALLQAKKEGFIPMLIMIIKHPSARSFSFAHHIDAKFSIVAEEFIQKYPFLKLRLVVEKGEMFLLPL